MEDIMGCDIHSFVEHKDSDTWYLVDDKFGPKSFMGKSWNIPRNYDLFGLLAGVRTWFIDPIKYPIGLPIDISYAVYNIWNSSFDWHTPSYYLLSELLNVENKKIYCDNRFVDIEQYLLFKERGYPEWFCLDVDQSSVAKKISNNEMERIVKNILFLENDINYYTTISYEIPLQEVCSFFWKKFVPAMKQLDSNYDNVRFVFWFDS